MPGQAPIPLGVYDHPPDPEFSFIQAVGVGSSGVARFTASFTRLVNEINDLVP